MAAAAMASPSGTLGGDSVASVPDQATTSQAPTNAAAGPDPGTLDSPDIDRELMDPKSVIDSLLTRSSSVTRENGQARGIQGLYHSSLLDSMLVSMFAFTTVFDCWLKRDARRMGVATNEVQRILSESIVNPLRERGFVGAKKVVALQLALQKAAGLPTRFLVEEIDLKKFLETLLHRGLGIEEPLCNLVYWHTTDESSATRDSILSSMKGVYALEAKVVYDERTTFVTTRQLLERESVRDGWKLLAKPRALLLVLERTSGAYGEQACCMPLPSIDIVDCVAASRRECTTCRRVPSAPGEAECAACYDSDEHHKLLCQCTFCSDCADNHLARNVDSDAISTCRDAMRNFARLTKDANDLVDQLRRVASIHEGPLGTARRNAPLQAGLLPAGLPVDFLDHLDPQQSNNSAVTAGSSLNNLERSELQLELAAVICKELFSYVAYVRTTNNQWVYYNCSEVAEETPSGVVNLPVMRLVENFESIVSEDLILKAGGNIPNEEETRDQHRVLHKSFAYLYCASSVAHQSPAGAGQQADSASDTMQR